MGCPFCGAELSREEGDYKLYKCFTDTYGPRTEECYDRQIANLEERLEAMEDCLTIASKVIEPNNQRLEAWREYGHAMRVHSGIWARAVDKLHELGEWAE